MAFYFGAGRILNGRNSWTAFKGLPEISSLLHFILRFPKIDNKIFIKLIKKLLRIQLHTEMPSPTLIPPPFLSPISPQPIIQQILTEIAPNTRRRRRRKNAVQLPFSPFLLAYALALGLFICAEGVFEWDILLEFVCFLG